ncbi:AraC family transcriptional regulator [Caulobacter segnis]|uniref:helix-turn-helix domain-containing protein n=1 Tax=Caulobacter segnis TaxID=88688 RepID=UPI00240EAC83|nr:AraC family transcriptional regulator [Caulobacter segnis]MDG2520472.1 AraC family transcriptional regulator [Caulobacter segnis]
MPDPKHRPALSAVPVDPLADVPEIHAPTAQGSFVLSRFRQAPEHDGVQLARPPEAAHVLVVQLTDHPAHDMWMGRRHHRTADLSAGAFHLMDLSGGAVVHTRSAVNSLHLYIPEGALTALESEPGVKAWARLQATGEWLPPDPLLSHLTPLLLAAVEDPSQRDLLFGQHLLLSTVAHIASRHGERPARRLAPGRLSGRQVRLAQDVLGADLGDSLSLTEVASACGLSVSHFARGFKIATGSTPHAWRQARRLARARDLLATSDLPLAEVALACGFAEQSYFTRLFKRETGLTPGLWRRENRRY